jgi:hypothetical protein
MQRVEVFRQLGERCVKLAGRELHVCGRGGVGIVYLAGQQNPRRMVALTMIRPEAATKRTLHRFAHEAQILGRLQRPGIGRVFEAGIAETDHGSRPFLRWCPCVLYW